jgi:hypothetical protein
MLLTADEIQAAGSMGASYEALWKDVQQVADRVHVVTGNEQVWAWHHLLLAVANFKAQAVLSPPALPAAETSSVQRNDVLAIPIAGGSLSLDAEDPTTWPQLTDLQGLWVPRASTALSALWPSRHIIMDWRALSAALALSGVRLGWDDTPVTPDSIRPATNSWESYAWYRDAVLQAARQTGEQPVKVERTLWKVGHKAPRITWAEYAEQVERNLQGRVG